MIQMIFNKGGLKGMFIADMIALCGLVCSICKRVLAETGHYAGSNGPVLPAEEVNEGLAAAETFDVQLEYRL